MEDCEREWPLGVAGIYNYGSGICECPEEARRSAALVLLLSSYCVLLGALYFSFQVYRKFDANQAAKRMTRVGSKGYMEMVGHSGIQATMRRVKASKEMLRIVIRRQRTIMLVYGFYILSILCSLPFRTSLLLDPPQFRYTVPFTIDFFLAARIGCYFSACSIIVHLYFTTLPNVDVMGKLLGIKSVYIRHPMGVYKVTIASLYVYAACSFLIGVVFPQLEHIDEQVACIVIYGYLVFFMLGAAELCCRFAMVSVIIIQLFNHALEASKDQQGMSVSIGLQRARQNTRGVQMLVLTGPFALGMAACMLSSLGLRMTAVLWTGLNIQLDLVLFFFCFFLSRELVGMELNNNREDSKVDFSKSDLQSLSSVDHVDNILV